jgi:N-acetylmuramoyl-L-alanine amidase
MRWSNFRFDGRVSTKALPFILVAAIILTASFFVFSAGAFSDSPKLLSIYSTVANYSLPVTDRNGQEYAALLEVLDPLGKVTVKTEGKRWKIHYEDKDVEFIDGRKSVRILRNGFDLPGNFLLENGRGLVPVSSLPQLLSRILGGPVSFHENARRIFIGNVGVHFTAQVSRQVNPALVINFTSPVNPTIATEAGKLHMRFSREALLPPGSPILTFDSKIIPSAKYEENNGTAEITVTGGAPLFAAFSDDRKTITITAAVQAQSSSPAAGTPSSTDPASAPRASAPAGTSTNPSSVSTPAVASPGATTSVQRKYFAVVDASHGGEDRGAALNDQLAEKDVTLAFARLLRQQLENRGITTLLLRDGDTSLSSDERASQTNSLHPAIYLCIHAASQGTGVRLYTSLIPAGGESHGPFIAWDTAQNSMVALSQSTAASVAVELEGKQLPVRTLAAPLRPLNNLNTVAIAVEISPAGVKSSDLYSSEYQQLVAGTVAAGIANARARLEAGQ